MEGKFPEEYADHINGIKDDNRWINLRSVTKSENSQNQRKSQSDNKSSGLLGVSWCKAEGKWETSINVNKKKYYIGAFHCKHEAHEAYLKKKRELHSTCTI